MKYNLLLKFAFQLCFFLYFIITSNAQNSESDSTEMDEMQWDIEFNNSSLKTILLLSKLDTLNSEIDSLLSVKLHLDTIGNSYQEKILGLVGITVEELDIFRNKFLEAENYILQNQQIAEEKNIPNFSEIKNSKAICLPEFSERYNSILEKIKKVIITKITQYTVISGDCLWIIADKVYENPALWTLIWEANKNGVINFSELPSFQQNIKDPNKIYPSQILKIPSLENK